MALLQTGDRFNLTAGMNVYTQMPESVIYQNKPFSEKWTKHRCIVGEVYRNILQGVGTDKARKDVIAKIIEQFNFNIGLELDPKIVEDFVETNVPQLSKDTFVVKHGVYKVTHTSYAGGGYGGRPGDHYANGYLVEAQKVGSPNVKISFYQTGDFDAKIAEHEVSAL